MSNNCPKLNTSTPEFIWLGLLRRLARCTSDLIESIQSDHMFGNLSTYIVSDISFTYHVTTLMTTCFFHIRQLLSVTKIISCLGSGTDSDALDYCNGLLGGAQKYVSP